MINTRGIAKNTEENREYLEKCGAVESMTERESGISFIFDPAKKPESGVPDGVYFDLGENPF